MEKSVQRNEARMVAGLSAWVLKSLGVERGCDSDSELGAKAISSSRAVA